MKATYTYLQKLLLIRFSCLNSKFHELTSLVTHLMTARQMWIKEFQKYFVYSEEAWMTMIGFSIDTVNTMWEILQPDLSLRHYLLWTYYYHHRYIPYAACATTFRVGKTIFKHAVHQVLHLCLLKCNLVKIYFSIIKFLDLLE